MIQTFKKYVVFALACEDKVHITRHIICFLPEIKTKDCNIMSDIRNIFAQHIKDDMKTYETLVLTDQRDDFTTGCVLDYPISKKAIR